MYILKTAYQIDHLVRKNHLQCRLHIFV